MLLFFANRNSPYEKRLGTPFDGQVLPWRMNFISNQSVRKTKSFSSIWYKDASRKFIEYAVNLEEVGLET